MLITLDKAEYDWQKNSKYVEFISQELINPGLKDCSLSLSFRLLRAYPTSSTVHLYASSLVNGQYLGTGVPMNKNICEFLKKDKSFMPSITQHGNITRRCPQKAGVYVLNKYRVDLKSIPAVLPKGSYKVDIVADIEDEKFVTTLYGRVDMK